jgi:hypothetical protein
MTKKREWPLFLDTPTKVLQYEKPPLHTISQTDTHSFWQITTTTSITATTTDVTTIILLTYSVHDRIQKQKIMMKGNEMES